MVRRRRDQPDARGRGADPADVAVDLVARQLAALAGLGALRHLDLDLVGVREVVHRHAEAAGGDLLDRRPARVAVRVGRVARRVLSALAGVRAPADPVHGDRERLVRLARERAERHRARREALDDLARRLDLVERDAAARGEAAARAARAARRAASTTRSSRRPTRRRPRGRRGGPRAGASRSRPGSTGGARRRAARRRSPPTGSSPAASG